MGACISYLYLEKGIRNFFVLAPNLTIYDKLIEDFGNPSNPKYVFNGIAEYVNNRPMIITGENYVNANVNLPTLFKDSEILTNKGSVEHPLESKRCAARCNQMASPFLDSKLFW